MRSILATAKVKRLASLSLRSSSSLCSSSSQTPITNTNHHHYYQSTILLPNHLQRARHHSTSIRHQSTTSLAMHLKFPWRHSPTPPTRLLNNDDYSGMPNNIRARFVRKLIAARELNLTFWNVLPIPLFGNQDWEEELASNFSVAFGLALSELLRTLFPAEGAARYEDQCVYVDSSVQSETKDNMIITTLENNDYLHQMMEQLLLQKFQHLNHDNNNVQIKLSLKPIQSRLQHIFAVPMLTRDIVASKPHLKGGYQRLEAVYKETKSYAEVKQKTYELAEEVGLESAQRTVIAEASVRCKEFFQVKDKNNGQVIQGMDDYAEEEEVVHLVRFEMVTDRCENGRRMGGNWKLIDIDDLLEGNVFH
jgi:hypothetical protein